MVKLVVHGGAWNIPDNEWDAHQVGCAKAQATGLNVLTKGGNAVDAVAAALTVLEDDPTFDAATGSFLNDEGGVECSAGLMEGQGFNSGAVLCVSQLRNPIQTAVKVLRNSEHCIFATRGAHRFAQEHGIALCEPDVLITTAQREFFQSLQDDPDQDLWLQGHDTVGAIALDDKGNLAAGNSTGGIPNKALGRIGDAALPGLGYYADDELGAFICTGLGEAIMQSTMGMRGLHKIAELGVQEAARFSIKELERTTKGYAGIIMISPDGEVGMAYNTTRMAHCLA